MEIMVDTMVVKTKDFKQLLSDVELIKGILISKHSFCDSEGELSDWAKAELEEARKIPNSKNISLEEIEKSIYAK